MAVPNDFALSDPLDYFPYGGANAGPMVARANIFFKKPHLMREAAWRAVLVERVRGWERGRGGWQR
ncbi:hypothetical protein [Ornithinicoccus halotolerans]|uniref:hypothetical protein n=1 Tax=Ornithinicoccus halotolerans TaxID=1748220 RepID=UPI00129669AF|nr:hypothetical protein [Ornithinicoccus halotolerans]